MILPGRGAKVGRVLRVDPAFDGMARECDVILGETERGAGSDAELLDHQIDARNHFGDRDARPAGAYSFR